MKNPTPISADAVKIRNIIDRIKQIRTDVLNRGFLMGQLLKQVRDEQLYFLHGHDTFQDFVADPDIDVSYPLACRFIKIYEVYILEHKYEPDELAGIEYTKLEMLLSISDNAKKVVDSWLDRARELRRDDLRKAVKEELGQEIKETITILKCPICGKESEYLKFEKRQVEVCG